MSTLPKFVSYDPEYAELPAFTLVGLSTRTSNAIEMNGAFGRIGPLWRQFMAGIAETIPGVTEAKTIYSVYTNYEGDENGAYDVILGKSVQRNQEVSDQMKKVQIPAQCYLVFHGNGNSPDGIRAAWMDVYRYFATHTDRQRAFLADFERYAGNELKLFIGIK